LNKDVPVTLSAPATVNLTSKVQALFHFARWLQRDKSLTCDTSADAEIERLYRIAAENDHHQANIHLQEGAMQGRFRLRDDEHLRLSQKLINAGVATGYYFIGLFLDKGLAGVKQDTDMALRYFRKAADEGHLQAQRRLSDQPQTSDTAPAVTAVLKRLAPDLRQSKAAIALSFYLQDKQRYKEAI
jgi:TPR repeat protein